MAQAYIKSIRATPHRYSKSRKKTATADSNRPAPKTIKKIIVSGNNASSKCQVGLIPRTNATSTNTSREIRNIT